MSAHFTSHGFCIKWGLSINISKTKVIVFGSNSRSKIIDFKIGNQIIERTDKYCYLGIVIHQNGNFYTALNELRKKALRALYGLKRVIIRKSLSFDALIKLFDSLIKPILLYGCQVIAPHNLDVRKLSEYNCRFNDTAYFNIFKNSLYEKFHIKYLKWCCGVHKKSSNIGIWGDTGRFPLIFNAIKLAIDYHERIKLCDDNTLVKKALAEQIDLNLDWYANIAKLTAKFGIGKFKRLSTNINQNLWSEFQLNWDLNKSNSSKLEIYNNIKSQINREPYLQIRNFDHRSAITKFRISAHKLNIETGRYTKPITPRNSRFCDYCLNILQNKIVEDEIHAIYDCPLYIMPRKKFHDSINKPILEIMQNSKNLIELSRLGKFCMDISDLRKAYLEYTKEEGLGDGTL